MSKVAVIIPCYDAPDVIHTYLPGIIQALSNPGDTELIFVDAYQRDDVRKYVESFHFSYYASELPRRSVQCNLGAAGASAPILFFLHIDSKPPQGFDVLIRKALAKREVESGCFQLRFDCKSSFLSVFAWFTRFKWRVARGGDQGLFVKTSVFRAIDGFVDEFQIMEDIDIAEKLLRRKSFTILKPKMRTSCRKYKHVGTVKLQVLFIWITLLYRMGFSNSKILDFYKNSIG